MQNLRAGHHAVQLNRDLNIEAFRDSRLATSRVRVVVHTEGAWPNGMSNNHISAYFLLNDGQSIRVNMVTDEDDNKGVLIWSRQPYQRSNSEITHHDIPLLQPVYIGYLYRAFRWPSLSPNGQLLHRGGLHRYLFSGGRSGCRFWQYVKSLEHSLR